MKHRARCSNGRDETLGAMKHWRHIVLPLAILAVAVGLRAKEPSLVEQARMVVFDSLQRLKPRPYRSVSVRIVDIDDESLERLGQWPWPRLQVARLVDRLRELGAAVIAFDIVFAEPDRTSPENVLRLWPDAPGLDELRVRLGALRDGSRRLRERHSADTGRSPTVSGRAGESARMIFRRDTNRDTDSAEQILRGGLMWFSAFLGPAAGSWGFARTADSG